MTSNLEQSIAVNMVDSSPSVPFYMQEESDDSFSDDEPTDSGSQSTESTSRGKIKGRKEESDSKEKKKKKGFFNQQKARVGDVSVDPRIGEQATYNVEG